MKTSKDFFKALTVIFVCSVLVPNPIAKSENVNEHAKQLGIDLVGQNVTRQISPAQQKNEGPAITWERFEAVRGRGCLEHCALKHQAVDMDAHLKLSFAICKALVTKYRQDTGAFKFKDTSAAFIQNKELLKAGECTATIFEHYSKMTPSYHTGTSADADYSPYFEASYQVDPTPENIGESSWKNTVNFCACTSDEKRNEEVMEMLKKRRAKIEREEALENEKEMRAREEAIKAWEKKESEYSPEKKRCIQTCRSKESLNKENCAIIYLRDDAYEKCLSAAAYERGQCELKCEAL